LWPIDLIMIKLG